MSACRDARRLLLLSYYLSSINPRDLCVGLAFAPFSRRYADTPLAIPCDRGILHTVHSPKKRTRSSIG